MSADHSTTNMAKVLPPLLEKLADSRFLILMLSFFCYLDIWLMKYEIDPTKVALRDGYESLKNVPIFTAVIFVLSYSLLMAGFFPALRKIIGVTRLSFKSDTFVSQRSIEMQRLSDWSFAFIAFSAYDLIVGYLVADSGYRGLGMFVLNFLRPDGLIPMVFRFCVVFLWLACISLALEVDDPSPNNP